MAPVPGIPPAYAARGTVRPVQQCPEWRLRRVDALHPPVRLARPPAEDRPAVERRQRRGAVYGHRMSEVALIMAAGKGTRMRLQVPKVLPPWPAALGRGRRARRRRRAGRVRHPRRQRVDEHLPAGRRCAHQRAGGGDAGRRARRPSGGVGGPPGTRHAVAWRDPTDWRSCGAGAGRPRAGPCLPWRDAGAGGPGSVRPLSELLLLAACGWRSS